MYKTARVKLTAWYLLIIMLISVGFSLVIFRIEISELQMLVNSPRFRLPPEIVDEIISRRILNLIFINTGILAAAGTLGYFLAGRTLKPIEEMVDEQNRFIADASHELKTPLTSLKSAFEVFLRDKKGTLNEGKTIITESILEVNKLQFLSESLLKLARFQKKDKNFVLVSLTETVEEAIKKVTPIAAARKIIISKNLEEVKIMGDKNDLTELAIILLDNAIKYSSYGNKIIVNLIKANSVLEVKDFGTGISENDLPHIFERFYRAEKSRSNNGFGLGLAIAKEIVQKHQGEISAKSQLGLGTIIKVTFHG